MFEIKENEAFFVEPFVDTPHVNIHRKLSHAMIEHLVSCAVSYF